MQNLKEALQTLNRLQLKKIATDKGFINSVTKKENMWKISVTKPNGEDQCYRLDNKTIFKFVDSLEYDAFEIERVSLPANILPSEIQQDAEVFKQINSLSQTLVDTIEKVKVDKEYVQQGKLICYASNSLIQLARLHINIIKATK